MQPNDQKDAVRRPAHKPAILRNIVWNFVGQVAPLLAAVASIPVLLNSLGMEAFGVLTIAWVVIGYFSLFDLGLSRALTLVIASSRASGRSNDIPLASGTALVIMLAMGVLGGGLVILLSDALVIHVLDVSAPMRSSATTTLWLLGATVPVVILTSCLRGILEGYERFDVANAIRIPLGLWTYLGPLIVLPFASALVPVIWTVVAGRIAGLIAHGWAVAKISPVFDRGVLFRQSQVPRLLRLGGWLTVTSIVSPLLTYIDRLVIAATVAVSAVAYYTTPFEVVTKIGVIPSAIIGVLYAALAARLLNDRDAAMALYARGVKAVFILVFAPVLILSTFASEGLALWLGPEFAARSFRVFQCLTLGVFLNALATVPYVAIQAAGRPDVTAKLHLLELPLYLPLLLFLVNTFGIVGAAMAWAARHAVDMVALYALSLRLLPGTNHLTYRMIPWLLGVLAVLFLGALIEGVGRKSVYVLAVMPAFLAVAWFCVLGPADRTLVRSRLRLRPRRSRAGSEDD